VKKWLNAFFFVKESELKEVASWYFELGRRKGLAQGQTGKEVDVSRYLSLASLCDFLPTKHMQLSCTYQNLETLGRRVKLFQSVQSVHNSHNSLECWHLTVGDLLEHVGRLVEIAARSVSRRMGFGRGFLSTSRKANAILALTNCMQFRYMYCTTC
jgi:hypothetical protein